MDTQKDLRVIISNDMSWNLHIDKAGLKAHKTFFAIKRNISNLNKVAKLNLLKSMIFNFKIKFHFMINFNQLNCNQSAMSQSSFQNFSSFLIITNRMRYSQIYVLSKLFRFFYKSFV